MRYAEPEQQEDRNNINTKKHGKAANALMIILLTFLSLLTPACVMAYLLNFLLTVPELFDGPLVVWFEDLKSSYVARVLTCMEAPSIQKIFLQISSPKVSRPAK